MIGGVPHAPKQSGGVPGGVPGGAPGDGVLGGVRAAADRGGVPGEVVGCEVPDGVRAAAGGGASTSAERVLASTSVTAIAAASAVPNQLADVISVPGCDSSVFMLWEGGWEWACHA